VGDNFGTIAGWLGTYGYPLLFAIVFAESAGLPVPGETAVLASSLMASRPDHPLDLGWVIAVAVVAAVLGDNLGFEVGRRWARARLAQGKRFLVLTPEGLKAVEGYFERYGTLTVFFSRFVTGLRVVCALAAGTSRMPWVRFFLANVGGAVAWAVAMSLLGYFFGQSWEALHQWMGRGALLILGCVVLLVGLPYLWRRFRRLPPGSWDRLVRSQAWQGALAALVVVLCVAMLQLLAERRGVFEEDEEVRGWIAARDHPILHATAVAGSHLGTLPVMVLLAALLGAQLHHARRPWREVAALVGALAASEGVGLLVLGLLRHRGIEPARALAWPFGFAGLAPLRGAAVCGMAAYLLQQQFPQRARDIWSLAVGLVLLIGFSVVWSHEQYLTEVLVEFVAGYGVFFAAVWWLEGYGLGPRAAVPVAGGAAEGG
jgi:membrane protein DedA with SNARE-associated domain